jgi:cardiolipin synthase
MLRILLVPVMIWLIIAGDMRAAFFILVIAGATDAIDGFLAKRFAWTTDLGAYLDPLADKLLLVSAFVTLGAQSHLPVWFVILVVSRDVMIVAAILLSVVVGQPVRMRPLAISKLNTLVQIVLALLVLADLGFGLDWGVLVRGLTYLTAILTASSAAAYMYRWVGHMAGAEAPRP